MRMGFPQLRGGSAVGNAVFVASRRRMASAAVVGLLASLAAVAGQAPAASAALHPGQYTLSTLTLAAGSDSIAGSYLACKNPSRQRIATGGSFWHAQGQGPDPNNGDASRMGSSSATFDAKGWYADGHAVNGLFLTITALCLPKSQLGTYAVRTHTFDVSAGNSAGGYVKCPPKQRIVTGGAFWHQPGQGPDPTTNSGYVASSSATFDAKGWYADGWTHHASQLTVTALCLPRSQVGTYTLKTETFNPRANGTAGGYLKCPARQRIVAGGAFWHQPGEGPDPNNAPTSCSAARPPRSTPRAGMRTAMRAPAPAS